MSMPNRIRADKAHRATSFLSALKTSVTASLAIGMFALCILGAPRHAAAQLSSTGTIRGSVKDATGGNIPAATVSVVSEDTHHAIEVKSSSDGTFVVTGLQPGLYDVRVEMQGFQTYSLKAVEVHPALVADVSPTLTVGAVTSEVTVTDQATQVQTSTPEVSGELSGEQVSTLPMNGRNYQSLTALIPGAVNTAPGTSLGQGGFSTSNVVSVNGMGLSGTFMTVDGIWNENTGNFTQPSVTPMPDSIQEVRLLQNNYSAQYNLMGANVLVVQMKSGGSTFHGSAWEFFRNDALNTRNYFSTTVPTLRENIYGFVLGGPLYIPHVYNTSRQKTFFFVAEQWSPVRIGSVLRGTTATAAQRGGDFSSVATPIIDPLTKAPFQGNMIPSYRISQPALALLNATSPLPNNPAGGFLNYLNSDPQVNSQRNDQVKIEHNLTSKYRLTGEYISEKANTLYSYNAGDSSPFNTSKENVDWNDYLAQVTFAATFTPNLVNQASIAMNHRVVSLTQQGITTLAQVTGYTQSVPFNGGLGTDRLPQINLSGGYSTFGAATGLPLIRNSNLDLTYSDDLSWSHGKHYIQAGFNLYDGKKRQTNISASNGSWTFTGATTGNALADYLLGYAATLSQTSTYVRPVIYFPAFSPYVQDTWKLSSKLTLSGGVRYLWLPTSHVAKGTQTIFLPSTYVAANAPIVNLNGTFTTTPNYNPLNGLVYNGVGSTPLNFSNAHENFIAPTMGFAYDVFGHGHTSLRGGYGIAYTRVPSAYDCTLTCANNPPVVQSTTLVNPHFPNSTGATVQAPGLPTLNTQDPYLQPSHIQSFSLSLQHDFKGGWFASVTAAGNIARHLSAAINLNQPKPSGGFDYNPVINSGTVSTYYYAPYQGYASITQKATPGVAYWNALELNLGHAAGHHFYLSAAYTYQHDLANVTGTSLFSGGASVQNPYNLAANYGNSQLNVPHVFAGSLIITLPKLEHSNAFTRSILGGWQYSDITTIQSGASLDPGLSAAKSGLATRSSYTGQSIAGPKTVAKWFNTAAFVQPAAGFYGNAAPGSIRGPGAVVFDMAAYKTFPIYKQHAMEFRAELFNIFNHTNFSAVSTSLGSGSFGQVTAARDPRIAEFALKYKF